MTFPPPGYVFSGPSASISTMGAMTIQGFLAATDVEVNAQASGTSLSPGTITVLSGFTWSSGRKLTMIADGSITILESVSSTATGLASTEVIVDLQAPVITLGALNTTSGFIGGTSGGMTTTGRVLVSAPTSLNLFGGVGVPSVIQGDAVVITAGDLTLHAGTTVGTGIFCETLFQGVVTGDAILIGSGGGSGISSNSMLVQPSTIDLTVGGDLTILGGDSLVSGSASAILDWGGGSITCMIGGDLILQGGSSLVDGNAAIFGQGGPATVQVSARDIYITGGSQAVMMGGSGNFAGIATFTGTVSVVSTGSNGIVLQGGSATDCTAFIQGQDGLNVTARSLQMVGGSVLTTASFVGGGTFCNVNVAENLILNGAGSGALIFGISGDLNVNVGGDCSITGSSLTPGMGISFTGLDAFGSAPRLTGNINLTTGNLSIVGGSGNFCSAGLGVGFNVFSGLFDTGGVIDLNVTGSTGIQLTGGSGMNSPAVIEILGPDPTNRINLTAPYPSANLLMTGAASEARIATLSGSITDPVGGSIILNGAATIIVGPGPASALLLIAGQNIELQSPLSSIQNLSGGDLTLVVDNQFPAPPLFGNGRFASVAGSSVLSTSGGSFGLLRIFTALQNLNSIFGTLNGQAFFPGTIFANSALEQWQTYFPSLFGGAPFTIFYKDAERVITQAASIVISEALNGLHPYDEFLYLQSGFGISYNTPLFPAETYFLYRRHLKLIQQPSMVEDRFRI